MASLRPEDVGRRVVIRYLTGASGPSGGPEMSDVIGHVLSVDPTSVTLERRTGDVVTVDWADVVACKHVPERR